MAAIQYAALVIPVAHAECMNRLLNQAWHDGGDNLSVRCSPTGAEPATHFLGGLPISDAEKAEFPYSKENGIEVDPEGPAAEFTQTQADDALAALEINIRTGNMDMILSEVATACINALFATMDPPLQKIIIGD